MMNGNVVESKLRHEIVAFLHVPQHPMNQLRMNMFAVILHQ
uniref:Uncharacterized protein n=1 Tax=Elaeophora elaphi TaxID=1147741 RepID=A0A0R3S4J2_9BILA